MSDDGDDTLIERIVESRRSFLQKGALASGAAAVGLGGLGLSRSADPVAGQDDNETATPNGTDASGDAGLQANGGGKALMFNDEFRPGAQFRVKSPVVEQNPDVMGVQEGDVFSEYNTRVIEYLNTDEEAYFFPAHDAEVEQGAIYELHDNFTLFDDDAADSGIIDVRFESVGEDDVLFPSEDNQLDPQEDFDLVEGGGKALVQAGDFHPGALIEITTDVVEWTPRPDVQGSDVFSEYNTRHARYLNTNDEFLLYPAEAADVAQGEVYLIQDEFDITDPEGQLVTTDLDRVDGDDLDDALLNGD